MKKYIILFVLFSHNIYSSGMSNRATVGSSAVIDHPVLTFSAAEITSYPGRRSFPSLVNKAQTSSAADSTYSCITWCVSSPISIVIDKAHVTKVVVNQGTRTDAEVLEQEEKRFREEREDMRRLIFGSYYMEENSIPQDSIEVLPIYNDEKKIVAVERRVKQVDPLWVKHLEQEAGLARDYQFITFAFCIEAVSTNPGIRFFLGC
jgi:hypothetical protein